MNSDSVSSSSIASAGSLVQISAACRTLRKLAEHSCRRETLIATFVR
ncbi:MAG: hypothetical protein AW07_03013 [Candidatus Accumulibacter sp. SK-11]|nr:MAG: hypothetical protein AW07_03013 [Candidatus Accumulibacter sp. SK-11]